MKRIAQQPRERWPEKLARHGFLFHSIDAYGVDLSGKTDKFFYWREDVAYRFTETEVETIYEAGNALHAMCLDLVDDLVTRGDLVRLRMAPLGQALAEQSWRRRDPHLYGRFDLTLQDGVPKLLEYNADTPTSLIESAVAQWHWMQEARRDCDQFNSIHEALVARWRAIADERGLRRVHLACLYDSMEDVGNVEYMMETVLQAGLEAVMLDLREIGLSDAGAFVDQDGEPIEACFKLYPWEWMTTDAFGAAIPDAGTLWLEPAWKQVLSNKALLPLLWERFEGHPNLLPAYFSPDALLRDGLPYVKKPIYSREGANVSFLEDGAVTLATGGDYGAEGYVYQALAPVPAFPAPETTSAHGPQSAMHAVLGAWIVADEACGLCVREDLSPVTRNTSYFVPHYFLPGL